MATSGSVFRPPLLRHGAYSLRGVPGTTVLYCGGAPTRACRAFYIELAGAPGRGLRLVSWLSSRINLACKEGIGCDDRPHLIGAAAQPPAAACATRSRRAGVRRP